MTYSIKDLLNFYTSF